MHPKLTIELVPSTSWFTNVRSEVTKDQWDVLRKDVYRKAGYRCEICGGKGDKWPVECHEVWNYDDINKIQKLDRLIALCPSCHQVKHIGLTQLRGKYNEALKHLSKVNNWTTQESSDYVKEKVQEYQERSCHTWTLDISYLDEIMEKNS